MIETLRFEDLSFAYEMRSPVLRSVSFEFPMVQKIEIRGELGSGRSSILKILAGLLPATEGAYTINDRDVTEMTFEEFLPYRLEIGYASDSSGLLSNRTLIENISLPLLYHSKRTQNVLGIENERAIEKRALELLDRYGVADLANLRPSAVSLSARKACLLARAFVIEPEVLLLDDPFLSLDGRAVNITKELIEESLERRRLRHVFLSARYERALETWAHAVVRIQNEKLFCESRSKVA